ncbi:hypothetical protein [Mycoplasmopsis bovis]|uniref:hypothetical protein n=1 Tax=Mycoplasmopsis bovis TaxID=28903 RepID=UPI00094B4CF1|nr:hypothetical protein [Mycoplasmopsis bovis]
MSDNINKGVEQNTEPKDQFDLVIEKLTNLIASHDTQVKELDDKISALHSRIETLGFKEVEAQAPAPEVKKELTKEEKLAEVVRILGLDKGE